MLPEFTGNTDLEPAFLFTDASFCIVGGTHHPLAARRKILWPELQAADWIQSPPDTALHDYFVEAFLRNGLKPPQSIYQSASFYSCIAILRTSNCLMMVPHEVGRHFASQLGDSHLVGQGRRGLGAILPHQATLARRDPRSARLREGRAAGTARYTLTKRPSDGRSHVLRRHIPILGTEFGVLRGIGVPELLKYGLQLIRHAVTSRSASMAARGWRMAALPAAELPKFSEKLRNTTAKCKPGLR